MVCHYILELTEYLRVGNSDPFCQYEGATVNMVEEIRKTPNRGYSSLHFFEMAWSSNSEGKYLLTFKVKSKFQINKLLQGTQHINWTIISVEKG